MRRSEQARPCGQCFYTSAACPSATGRERAGYSVFCSRGIWQLSNAFLGGRGGVGLAPETVECAFVEATRPSSA